MKTLEIPEEIKEQFYEIQALADCRDIAIKSLFGKKRAVYYAIQMHKLKVKTWNDVKKLYPETENGAWAFDFFRGVVRWQ